MKEELLIFKKGEATVLSPKPFLFELVLEGYIADNPNILTNPSLDLEKPEVKETELDLGDKNGRIDMLLQYDNDDLAIVELKNVPVDDAALDQLLNYLDVYNQGKPKKDDYPESQLIGILVGPEITDAVIQRIENDMNINFTIYAVSLKRYFDDGKWYVFTKWYSPLKTKRNYTKYKLPFIDYSVGKGRMVFEIIKHYVKGHPAMTFDELREVFPDSLRNVKTSNAKHHTIVKEDDVEYKDRYSRYFREPLKCSDTTFLVSSQWGIGNIDPFIAKARSLGYKITEIK